MLKRTLAVLLLALSAPGAGPQLGAVARGAAPQPPAPVVAFEGVNVLPMDAYRILQRHTVVVRGDRITAVGPASRTRVPDGALRIDGRGRFLIPGLGEMHGHVPPPSAAPELVETVLFLYVANGVTTVRGMLGAPNQLELRAKANRGEIVSPTLYLAGPSFSGSTVKTPEEAAARVRRQKAEGWDLLKVHPGLSRAVYDAMAGAAGEAGIRFAGHVPADVGILHALESGQETIDHLDGYIEHLQGDKGLVPSDKLEEIADRTKEAGAWVVPTMALWETLLGLPQLDKLRVYPELRYMQGPQVLGWIDGHVLRQSASSFDRRKAEMIALNRTRLLRVLHQRRVPILFGTDAPQAFSVPGFSIHREMPKMLEAGMRPYDILLSATRSVGRYFKGKDRFGTIEAGSRADLMLLDGDPFANLANLQRRAGVMVRGRWLPESEIQERLHKIAAPAAGH